MFTSKLKTAFLLIALVAFPLTAFSDYYDNDDMGSYSSSDYQSNDYSDNPDGNHYEQSTNDDSYFYHHAFKPISSSSPSFPSHINGPGEKVVIVDPHIHKFGAYDADGNLVRLGLASAGRNYCPDEHSPCRTHVGSFRVFALGDEDCYSTRFPIPHGGAPMPYCMYFSNNQALHGSYELGNANLSHGCVRMHVSDARWLRYNFVENGTLVVVRPY